jgi:hypothetical protein
LKEKRDKMGDKGKRDKGKREEQKKGKHTLKEKRKQKKRQNEIDLSKWKINVKQKVST